MNYINLQLFLFIEFVSNLKTENALRPKALARNLNEFFSFTAVFDSCIAFSPKSSVTNLKMVVLGDAGVLGGF